MNKPKYIKNWNELKEEKSPTHIIEMDESGYCGWITPKIDDGSWKNKHYLSTHTFYGGTNEYSTKILQECGFNVVLANWDKEGDNIE